MQNTAFSTNKTLNVNGRLIDLSHPRIMAILNITPDSFYAGSRYNDEHEILKRTEAFLQDGATFIDIGGYSSRPGATDISIEEELNRVLPVIRAIKRRFSDAILSIDTFRSRVAAAAVHEGAALINDISAGQLDHGMFDTVAKLGVPYIMMHMKGNPQNMSQQAAYRNLVLEVIDYFHPKLEQLRSLGVKDVIIDPGFGFAKLREHNFELLNQLQLLTALGKPVLCGLSRKSMIWKTLDIIPDDALNGTTVLNTMALLKGASILRVHDVREASQTIQLVRALNQAAAETSLVNIPVNNPS